MDYTVKDVGSEDYYRRRHRWSFVDHPVQPPRCRTQEREDRRSNPKESGSEVEMGVVPQSRRW